MKKETELKERQKVEIPFEHIHPELQGILKFDQPSLKKIRGRRVQAEIITGISTFLAYNEYLAQDPTPLLALDSANATLFTINRVMASKIIQKMHERITHSIKQNGVLHPDLEDETREVYGNWSKPANLAKTHPIFYVKGNGNIVFLKNSRMEYYRYLAQKSLPGKVGVHPWRWRGYLTPPEAPESVKQWAKAKVERLAEKLAPTPLPTPARVKLK